MAFNVTPSPRLWKAHWGITKRNPIPEPTPNPYDGGSAYNYAFPAVSNWDGGSAETGKFPVGIIDGGHA